MAKYKMFDMIVSVVVLISSILNIYLFIPKTQNTYFGETVNTIIPPTYSTPIIIIVSIGALILAVRLLMKNKKKK